MTAPAFSWDGQFRSGFFTSEGPIVFSTDMGILVGDNAPKELQFRDYVAPHEYEWVTGWCAIVPLGENGAVLRLMAEGGLEVDELICNLELGPDPYRMSRPECVVRRGAIVRACLLADTEWQYWKLMLEWRRTVRSRTELLTLMAELASMQVVRSL